MSRNDNPLELTNLAAWRENLGLLPVPLFATAVASEFLLLNGSRGNFCLKLEGTGVEADVRSHAWSSNVSHSVTITKPYILVQRWDQKAPQRHRCSDVALNLEAFHRELERDTPPVEVSVLAHAIRTFRSLRAAMGSRESGATALGAFLVMLLSAAEGQKREDVDPTAWGLAPESVADAASVSRNDWESLLQDLVFGRKLDDLRADIRLTLRHASGALFQEAHMIALFDQFEQTRFAGFAPKPVSLIRSVDATGAHFTPSSLARTLVEQTLRSLVVLPDEITVLDPACGSGEFLKEAMRQLRLSSYRGRIRLVGFDISPAACALARFTLAWEARDNSESTESLEVDVQCVDAMSATWPSNIDLVLMNPPFMSWQDMPPDLRDHVKSVLGVQAHYRPDLAAAFLWKAVTTASTGAAIGAILPASLLDGDSYEKLRRAITDEITVTLAARLGSHHLFRSVRVDASLIAAVKKKAAAESNDASLAVWADHRESSSSAALRWLRRLTFASPAALPVLGEGFSIYPRDFESSTRSWAPRPFTEWSLTHSLAELPKVEDIFDVRQGVRTGLNSVFLVDRRFVTALPEAERSYFRPAVLNESIVSGQLNDHTYVFYPHGDSSIDDEDTLQMLVPTYYRECLQPAKHELLRRTRTDDTTWWKLSEHRAWQTVAKPKLVSTYFGDAGSFAWDELGAFTVVQGFAWEPRASDIPPRSVWLAYLALLNSRFFSSLLSATSNNVGGGQWNLSKKFVRNVPMPDLRSFDPEFIRDIAVLGAHIHERGLAALSLEQKDQLQDRIESVYALPSV